MAARTCTASLVLTYFCVLIAIYALMTCQTEGRVVRIKRQVCPNGNYSHDGRNCCKCASGQKVMKHCTNLQQTECDLCEAGKEYQSHANDLETCEPCTSCTQTNANLEVDQPCTPHMNSVCKCKKNHYCPSGRHPCKICEPCTECGPEGVEEACSATSDTICKDNNTDNTTKILLGIFIPLAVCLGIGAGVALYIWKKKRGSKNIPNEKADSTEEEPFIGVSLMPHIPQIAEEIGWMDMKNFARKEGIRKATIENIESDYPNNGQERTIKLLGEWVEREGRDAPQKLIQKLRQYGKNDTAERVKKILVDATKNSANTSV